MNSVTNHLRRDLDRSSESSEATLALTNYLQKGGTHHRDGGPRCGRDVVVSSTDVTDLPAAIGFRTLRWNSGG